MVRITICILAATIAFSPQTNLNVYAQASQTSALWGTDGEKWSPTSQLPDFSFAGYARGERPLPTIPIKANVKDFGAKGDGKQDDSDALLKAIASLDGGAILIPAGRYRIEKIIGIRKPGIVLRGEGTGKTTLYFPKPLNDLHPNWGATTTGERTSNYSWSGGFFSVQGDSRSRTLTAVSKPALRGDKALTVESTDSLKKGQTIEILQRDNSDNSLVAHLYSGDPSDTSQIRGNTQASLVCKITAIEGNTIRFDRPLRCDVELRWQPVIKSFSPTVTEVGIESLTFEFPPIDYMGHFTELGQNALSFRNVANCWARDIRIVNCDSGVFLAGHFCTIDGLVIESSRKMEKSRSATGHHGLYASGDDNLFTRFDFRTRFMHDLTVSRCAGNVMSNGKGVDMCFDHHKNTPYENCFTDIDVGTGSRVWQCGGGANLGRNCAARGTFWNIRAVKPIPYPGRFGPASMNLVAVTSDKPTQTEQNGIWRENIPATDLVPQNIHEAQLKKRLQ